MSEDQLSPEEEIIPFMSFQSFRDTHRELLKQRRNLEKGQEPAEFWDDAYEFLARGEAAGQFLDNDEDRDAAQNLLDYWQNQLFHASKSTPDAILKEFDPYLQPEIPDERCPYIGLNAFDDSNRHLFYGRSQLINDILSHIMVSRLVAAIGPSGSGKSSVILAGVLPRLKDGGLPDSADWRYYPTIVPGSTPLTRLARLLQPEDVDPESWITENVEQFHQDPEHLAHLINEAGFQPAILVIDQFEETFTLCHDEEERDAFLNNLLNLIRTQLSRHVVLLTMRVDYESYLNKVPLFQSLFEQGQVRVSAMNSGELHEAIEKPAEAVGLKFQDGLVDALVREIVGEPAALPLLQFTLLQLWDNRERNRVTWEAYRRLGGVTEALANTADRIYNEMLPEDQVTTKRVLLRLVRPDGLEFTRRRVPRKLLYSDEANDRVDRVLERWTNARLLYVVKGHTADDDQVEVAHEALVRNWPRLVEWLEDERIALRNRLRLSRQAEDWDARGRDDSLLLRGALLTEALQYSDLNPLEQDFLNDSEAAIRAAEEEKETARQRELDNARQLAEEQRQRAEAEAKAARRLRYFSITLLVLLVAVIITVFGWNNLRNQSLLAESERQAAELAAFQAEATAEAANQDATQVAQVVEATATEAYLINATSTVERATSQAVATEQRLVNANSTATAVNAANATQQSIAIAAATQTVIAMEQTEPTISSSSSSLPTSTPNPEQIMVQLGLDAQLNARIRDTDNMPMFYITGQEFEMGWDNGEIEEQPEHTVLVNDFYLDIYEVNVQQYSDFLNSVGGYRDACDGEDCTKTLAETGYSYIVNNLGTYAPKPGSENHPVNWVSWYGANAYCQWVGEKENAPIRLPTEAEWEYAARGIDGRLYPWGDEEPEQNVTAVFGYTLSQTDFGRALRSVNELPDGISPFGIYNMAGNILEWVQDDFDADFYRTGNSTSEVNLLDNATEKILRGGSWFDSAEDVRTTKRFRLDPALPQDLNNTNNLVYSGVGFRCAQDIE